MKPLIQLTHEVLDPESLRTSLATPDCGAVLVFHGNVREQHEGRDVVEVEYSAYEAMARQELEQIALKRAARHGVRRVAIAHRLGRVPVPESSLVVVVASVHRREAFECALGIIDDIKQVVPIWKREVGPDGTRWQDGITPTAR